MRPLWFEYPDDPGSLLTDDEFLSGRDLLVAPVVHQAQNQRRVYFPRGDAWRDWWSGERHDGGTSADVAAPIDRLPLFVRAGAAISTEPVIQSTAELPRTPLTITVALGADGESNVYQDKGDGYAYRKGESRSIHLTLHGDTLQLRIPVSKKYQRVGAVEFIGVAAAPAAIKIDGKAVQDMQFDAQTQRLRVVLPSENVREVALMR